MGFLLALFTIWIIPLLINLIGWNYALMILALGPAFGVLNIARVRKLPKAELMAFGNIFFDKRCLKDILVLSKRASPHFDNIKTCILHSRFLLLFFSQSAPDTLQF